MLTKLIGYEMKAFGRIILPLYAATIGMALIMGLGVRVLDREVYSNILGAVIVMVFTTLILATMVMTGVLCVQRFYSNLLGKEGYLMFSLPVETHQLILSKVLSSLIWTLLGGVAGICTVAAWGLTAIPVQKFVTFFREDADLCGDGNRPSVVITPHSRQHSGLFRDRYCQEYHCQTAGTDWIIYRLDKLLYREYRGDRRDDGTGAGVCYNQHDHLDRHLQCGNLVFSGQKAQPGIGPGIRKNEELSFGQAGLCSCASGSCTIRRRVFCNTGRVTRYLFFIAQDSRESLAFFLF